jgi:hypothetical protein
MIKYPYKTIELLDSISSIMLIIGAFLKILHFHLGQYFLISGFFLAILISILKTVEIRRLKDKIKKIEDNKG